LRQVLAARMAERTTADWIATLEAHDVLCADVLPPGAIYAHPQAVANGMVATVHHPALGPVRVVASPVKLSATPATVRTPPPRVGEHTREILAEAGYSPRECDALFAAGVVA
jgi:crotonobetainyl-CoA:carnitine CoA-transferase CaiB-like acyl-CoA transferase